MESSVKLEGSYCVSFNEHRQQYPAYHRRREQTRFSQGFVRCRVAPTDCQDSIPTNFRSRARKHVSSRRRKEEVGRWKEQMKFARQECTAEFRDSNTSRSVFFIFFLFSFSLLFFSFFLFSFFCFCFLFFRQVLRTKLFR